MKEGALGALARKLARVCPPGAFLVRMQVLCIMDLMVLLCNLPHQKHHSWGSRRVLLFPTSFRSPCRIIWLGRWVEYWNNGMMNFGLF